MFPHLSIALVTWTSLASLASAASPEPTKEPVPPNYAPSNFVRLMAVAVDPDAPFLTAVVTTNADQLVVANIPNGDPPTAFNVSVGGFRAQNGKFLFLNPGQLLTLVAEPHNETEYMSDGSINVANQGPMNSSNTLRACPGSGNIFTLSMNMACPQGSIVQLFPIPPQYLSLMWENATKYPTPKQRGWLVAGANESGMLGDNSTFIPFKSQGTMEGEASSTEAGLYGTLLFALLALVL